MKAYFEKLSTEHKAVAHSNKSRHFFRSIDHFLNDDSNNLSNFPAVVMDSLEGKITGQNSDNKTDLMQSGVMFIKKITDSDDDAGIDLVHREMKALALSFVARMERDAQMCETRDSKFLQLFDPLTVKYRIYGPVFDQCYGVHIAFTCGHIAAISFNDGEWNIQ